jgi:hypothetical protein
VWRGGRNYGDGRRWPQGEAHTRRRQAGDAESRREEHHRAQHACTPTRSRELARSPHLDAGPALTFERGFGALERSGLERGVFVYDPLVRQ